MPLSRLLTLIIGLSLILGLMLWLINSLYGLYVHISWTAPLLANLLLLLVIVLLGLLIFALIYYVGVFGRVQKQSRRRRRPPKVPVEKTEAAEENLKALRKQVAQIQDEVARQELLMRSREIEAILSRGELMVVVFGTGSAGKTSLVNALIGRMVGQVGAPMGTTEVGETYTLKFKKLERKILITDTPGILEAGVAGTQREQMARQLATEADLLLFVVDNDLRQSEYEPLRGLAEIGKRSLLVLNKTDLYTEEDKETILARLRQRVGEEARRLIDTQRRRQAEKVVERFQWIGAGVVAVTPLPMMDLLAAAAVNAQMVVEIGKIYGCELNMERGKELALSLGKTLASLGIVKGAIELLSTALELNLATLVVGKAIQGVTAAYLTRIAGKSFIEYFRNDQDWGDGGITEVVQKQFQLNRKDEFIKAFVQQAIARVVKPLAESSQ